MFSETYVVRFLSRLWKFMNSPPFLKNVRPTKKLSMLLWSSALKRSLCSRNTFMKDSPWREVIVLTIWSSKSDISFMLWMVFYTFLFLLYYANLTFEMHSEKSVTYRTAPNIALIKYWGKRDKKDNLPLNSSISLTLDNVLWFYCGLWSRPIFSQRQQ